MSSTSSRITKRSSASARGKKTSPLGFIGAINPQVYISMSDERKLAHLDALRKVAQVLHGQDFKPADEDEDEHLQDVDPETRKNKTIVVHTPEKLTAPWEEVGVWWEKKFYCLRCIHRKQTRSKTGNKFLHVDSACWCRVRRDRREYMNTFGETVTYKEWFGEGEAEKAPPDQSTYAETLDDPMFWSRVDIFAQRMKIVFPTPPRSQAGDSQPAEYNRDDKKHEEMNGKKCDKMDDETLDKRIDWDEVFGPEGRPSEEE